MKIGLISEGKIPPDNRVALTPKQAAKLNMHGEFDISAESSEKRCYSDKEYSARQIEVKKDLSDCELLLGIKEVPVEKLIPAKSYMFFSHTIKKQPYNKAMLQDIIEKKIRLIDYERLTWDNGERILGFGRWAGIVGAHNGLLALGKRTGQFDLKPAHECNDYEEVKKIFEDLEIPPVKIVVTGDGRVAKGTTEVLDLLKIKRVEPEQYLAEELNEPVYVQLDSEHLYRHKERDDYIQDEFYVHPEEYKSLFKPYLSMTDLMINAIYWHPHAPRFFTKEDLRSTDFRIKTIADITCDIEGSVPCTLKASTIDDPVYGYDPERDTITKPYGKDVIDIMAVDNLPNELPRDASADFGEHLLQYVIPEFLKEKSIILQRATITENGELTAPYEYLKDYVEGKEEVKK